MPPETPAPPSPDLLPRAPDLDPEFEDFCNRFDLSPCVEELSEDETNPGVNQDVEDDLSDGPEIVTQTELDRFSAALQEAQQAAIEAERERERMRKRKTPKTYTGNSKKTLYRHRMAKQKLESKGFYGIAEYLELKKTNAAVDLSGDLHAPVDQGVQTSLSEMADQTDRNTTADQQAIRDARTDKQADPNMTADQQADPNMTADQQATPGATADHQADPDAIVDQQPDPGNPDNPDKNMHVHTRDAMRQEEESEGSEDSRAQPDAIDLEDEDSDNSEDRLGSKPSLRSLLEDLRKQRDLLDQSPPSSEDNALDLIRSIDRLQEARTSLDLRSKDHSLDLFLRARILAMIGVLNLFLDSDLGHTWRQASLLVSKTQGHGVMHARNIRRWILSFLRDGQLPHHRLYQMRWSILNDEDIAQEIQLQLTQRSTQQFIKASDVMEIVASPEMQDRFAQIGVVKPSISERTAQRWLWKMQWRYRALQRGMYADGHEREDVVAYRKAFVDRWMGYEKRFHIWDDDGNPMPPPKGFPVPGYRFRLILITHDESTFYQNDERKTRWAHKAHKAPPQPKGEGQTIMVSDFLTVEWGCLRDGEE